MTKRRGRPRKGEQLQLIEVGPKNIKEIEKHVRAYKEALSKRLPLTRIESKEKQAILDLVKKANLQPLEDGEIRFHAAGMLIRVIPEDITIKLKDADGEKKKESKPGKNKSDKSMARTVAETE